MMHRHSLQLLRKSYLFDTCQDLIFYRGLYSCNIASKYSEPIYPLSKLEESIKDGTASELQFIPIKAAPITHSSSVFHDPIVTKFINYVMKTGQRELARKLVEETLFEIKKIQIRKYNAASSEEAKASIICNPLKIFHAAVENCRPLLLTKPIKRGGITYQVPYPVTEKESYFRSMKWLVESGRNKEKHVHFPQQMANDLIESANNTGRVVKQKHDIHKLCEANKAYAHYRWS